MWLRGARRFGAVRSRGTVSRGLRIARQGAKIAPVNAATAADAVSLVKSGDRVFVHSVCATPLGLVKALCDRHEELSNVQMVHIHTEGDLPYADEPVCRSIRALNLFIGRNMRKAVNAGRADYMPVFLSQISSLFRSRLPLDVALLTVSPPDRHGYCSLGTSVDVSVDAMFAAKKVVAVINKNMPRTHGEGLVHFSNLDVVLESDAPLPEAEVSPPDEVEYKIGQYIASLVENGSTLQMGIGAIPNAVLANLRNHEDLGIHTEMFSEGVIDLLESGVVTNSKKVVLPHVFAASFLMGTKRLFDWVNDNPMVQMHSSSFINDPHMISKNPRVVAINSAIEVDLTGQVCADSIGEMFYSGVGGQLDFERGAALSPGGVPIIALPSTTSKGESRIVSELKPGAGVVTSRAHVHWVVTEYGTANMFGLSVRERALALINLAHPNHRERLSKEMAERIHYK